MTEEQKKNYESMKETLCLLKQYHLMGINEILQQKKMTSQMRALLDHSLDSVCKIMQIRLTAEEIIQKEKANCETIDEDFMPTVTLPRVSVAQKK